MYINQIDDLFDGIIDNFNTFLIKEKTFDKLLSDTNFVKYQNDILGYIKKYIETISKKDILEIIKNESYMETIINIIKRYCAFYIYLGIGYYYNGGRDLYITNIIESSKYQKDAIFQITNFFNSENNSKIITFYNDIKNIQTLVKLKAMDKIKIALINNPIKYDSTIKLFNSLGEDYVIEYFLENNTNNKNEDYNFHNVMKTFIFTQIYINEEKNDILNVLNHEEAENVEYKYIDIIVSNEKKIVDFNFIQKFLKIEQLNSNLAEEIYQYLEDIRDTKEIVIKENLEFINYLFSNEILVPITEEFLRYHKDSEKYESEKILDLNPSLKERQATKIKYITNKINYVKNFYSPLLDKNPELKLTIKDYFYKQLDPKMAVLYNNDEEIKIIQKLQLSDQASDYDLLVDLENLRKYAYVNFKNFSKDGIKIRPSRTIQSIRYINLKNKKKDRLETRIGHNNIDINIIGIAWNPTKLPLSCFELKDLLNVVDITNDKNGYNAFTKIMKKTFNSKNKKLYYWLFNNENDKPKTNKYIDINSNDPTNNIKVMLELIYYNYIDLVNNKIYNYINSVPELNNWNFYNLMKAYNNKYFDFNLNPLFKNNITSIALFDKINELDIVEDDIDSLIPGKRDELIKLPVLKIDKVKQNIIVLGKKEETSEKIDKYNLAVCMHYIKWDNIQKMSKKTDEFSQAVADFVKQYVKTNIQSDYICKSCNELIQIQKYVAELTYNEEEGVFLTTSIVVNQKLEETAKYANLSRSIRNMEKNIEKFAYSTGIIVYIGNTPVIKLRRKMVIKETIDLLLVHTEWLRDQPKNRIELFGKKYGTSKDFTNLFFFKMEDNIFISSSTDIDQFKRIKYNNILAYLLFIIICDLNPGQIVSFKEDNKFNYFYFKKVINVLFDELYIRLNQKEKIQISKVPLFAYILYYLSGIMVSSRIWNYNDSDVDPKNKLIYMINMQKSVIHTTVDLINTLVEASFNENRNYLYEIIYGRFMDKFNKLFNDIQLLKRIEINNNKFLNIDDKTNIVTFTKKTIDLIEINSDFKMLDNSHEYCSFNKKYIVNTNNYLSNNNANIINLLTNCDDGKFHQWEFTKRDLICRLCNKSYNELIKLQPKDDTKSSKKFDYLNKIKEINLIKLSKKYCISGETHESDQNGKCIKCGVIIDKFIPNEKELITFEKNIATKTNETFLDHLNLLKNHNEKIIKDKEKTKKIINKLYKKYEKETDNKIEIYINKFIDKLVKLTGDKIKLSETTEYTYIKDTVYIIDHDYIGYPIKNSHTILVNDPKIKFVPNHSFFNTNIIYFKDATNKNYVYYDFITLQYLGYSDDNTSFKKTKQNASLKISHSIKDSLLYLGFPNKFINMFHINKNYQYLYNSESNTEIEFSEDETKEIILNIIRTRINNLKQIILRGQSMIHKINYNKKDIDNKYNLFESKIINEFNKKIKNIKVVDDTNHNVIFKNYKYITTRVNINYNIPNIKLSIIKNYLDIQNLIHLENNDNKLLFYFINNLDKILEYNKKSPAIIEIVKFIINIIVYSFNMYYTHLENYNITKFDFLLINETPYIDETLKVKGHYQELMTQQEIDDPNKKEEDYDNKEAMESLDIDDYENDEDNEGYMEALDGFE